MTGSDWLLALAGLVAGLAGAAGFVVWRVQRSPANAPERLARDPRRPLVVCAGASVTRGSLSVDYVARLEARLGARFQFANAGRNGDLAFNLAQRLEAVVALRPDVVVLQIGTNDVNASLAPEGAERYRRLKGLPVLPSREFYRDNLALIMSRLRKDTRARLAVLSLPLMGENLAGVENARVRSYNDVIREVAAVEGASYLPLYESMAAVLETAPSARPAVPASRLIASSVAQHYLFGRSFDAIGAANGYQLLSDGIHLNRRAAELVADQIEAWLEGGME